MPSASSMLLHPLKGGTFLKKGSPLTPFQKLFICSALPFCTTAII
jgi:hypothetical protein